MPSTLQPAATPLRLRPLSAPLRGADSGVDKGPKHVGFDAPNFGGGRRNLEREQRLDRKR